MTADLPAPRFGVYAPPAPEAGLEPIDELECRLARPISIVMWYQHWSGWGAEPEPDWVGRVAAAGRLPLITWEPWSPGSLVEPPFRLERIAAGAFDGYVGAWADALRDCSAIVYLRPMHEMNGNWYPWAGAANDNRAEDYGRAWRRLHDIFTDRGARNVRWVWSPYASDVPATPENALERYYPGERYVDVLAVDGYNWGADRPDYGGWQTFAQVFSDAYRRLSNLGPQPIWVAETASDGSGGDKAAWVRDMWATAARMSRLQAIVWFHINKERDWRATVPGVTAAAFSWPPV